MRLALGQVLFYYDGLVHIIAIWRLGRVNHVGITWCDAGFRLGWQPGYNQTSVEGVRTDNAATCLECVGEYTWERPV